MEEESTERLRIAYDLRSLAQEAIGAMVRAKNEGKDPQVQAFWTLWLGVMGYCETDLGLPPPEESMSDWRERLEEHGADMEWTHHLCGPERRRAAEQRQRYAELMAPKLVERMLEGLKDDDGTE